MSDECNRVGLFIIIIVSVIVRRFRVNIKRNIYYYGSKNEIIYIMDPISNNISNIMYPKKINNKSNNENLILSHFTIYKSEIVSKKKKH